jgi:sec-independent protein translocase protein TatA
MGALSPLHLVIILVVALLVLGPGKLPETGAALGRAIRDFRRAVTDDVAEPEPQTVGGPTDLAARSESTPPPTAPNIAP